MKYSRGVIHIGASTGQERYKYNENDLNVIFVEAIPDIFLKLKKNISIFNKQKAYLALITDRIKPNIKFYVASNNGESSSVLPPALHRKLYPQVSFPKKILLNSLSLGKFIEKYKLDLKNYDSLVLDTQGSELMILKGAKNYLHSFKFVKTEVCNFESYKGCAKFKVLNKFMLKNGFKIFRKEKFFSKLFIGSYFNITYKNTRFK